MSAKNATPNFVITFVLITLTFLTGCQAANNQRTALAASESEVDYLAVENAMLERWQAMAHFYESRPLPANALTGFSAEEIASYRWNAAAKFYIQHPYAQAVLTSLSADEISAYRWQAMARFYAENPFAGQDLRTLSPDEILAFRWNAIARAYEKSALVSMVK